MMIHISKRNIYLMLSIVLLVISSTEYVVHEGWSNLLEMITFTILMLLLLKDYINMPGKYRKAYINKPLFIIAILFSIGLLTQNILISRKVILLFTMYAILICALMAENYMNSFKRIRFVSYVLLGVSVFVVIASAILERQMVTNSEGFLGFKFAFNGGIVYKNYFGGNLLCILIGLAIYKKNVKNQRKPQKWLDNIVLAVTLGMLLITNSRGALLLAVIFLFMLNYSLIKKISRVQRGIFILVCIGVGSLLAVYLYSKIALNSQTYLYRFRGFINYFNYFGKELSTLFLGNAELAYEGGQTYVINIRSITGYDGSMEIAYLNIIVKNGIVGLIGYIIIFSRFAGIFNKSPNWNLKASGIAVLVTLLMSGLVESYLQSVHAVFGIYCYLIMSGMAGMIHQERKAENDESIRRLQYALPATYFPQIKKEHPERI